MTATVVELHCERPFDDWKGEVPIGASYLLLIDGEQPVLDPRATEVWFPQGHSRDAVKPGGALDLATFPRAVARPWPAPRPSAAHRSSARGLRGARPRIDEVA